VPKKLNDQTYDRSKQHQHKNGSRDGFRAALHSPEDIYILFMCQGFKTAHSWNSIKANTTKVQEELERLGYDTELVQVG